MANLEAPSTLVPNSTRSVHVKRFSTICHAGDPPTVDLVLKLEEVRGDELVVQEGGAPEPREDEPAREGQLELRVQGEPAHEPLAERLEDEHRAEHRPVGRPVQARLAVLLQVYIFRQAGGRQARMDDSGSQLSVLKVVNAALMNHLDLYL